MKGGFNSRCLVCRRAFENEPQNHPLNMDLKRRDRERTKAWKQTPKGVLSCFYSDQGRKAQRTKQAHPNARYVHPERITPDEYAAMLAAQENKCAICREPPKRRRLFIDHCHATGKIRGLLCPRCNTKLASVERHPELFAYLAYLTRAASL
jgi:hypothetical protein